MPQLDISTYPAQIAWLLVTFIVLYLLMSKVVLPLISGVMQSRCDKIDDLVERAQGFQKRAETIHAENIEKLEQARSQAHAIIAQAQIQISEMQVRQLQTLDHQLNAQIAEAKESLNHQVDAFKKDLPKMAQSVCDQMTHKLLLGSQETSHLNTKAAGGNE